MNKHMILVFVQSIVCIDCCCVVSRWVDESSGACSGCLLPCLPGKTAWISRLHCAILCVAMWIEWRCRDNSSEHFLVRNLLLI